MYDLVGESLNMKDKHDRVTNIETEVEDQNKLIELHDDTKDDKDKEDNNYYNNDDGKFKCKLCLQRLDGYHKSKLHYVKEHRTYINYTKKGNICELGFCMDIEKDRCSQF